MDERHNKIMKCYVAVYSVLCINIALFIMPESVLILKYIIGEKATDFIYDHFNLSEHVIVPFLCFCAVLTVFMLFLVYRLKPMSIEKRALIFLMNIVLPHLALWAQRKEEIFLIVLVPVILVVSYTIQSALNISIKISVEKENKTEAEASE